MAMGTAAAVGLGLQGLGMGYNAWQQNNASNRLNQRQDDILAQAAGMRQNGMGEAEQLIMQLLGGAQNNQSTAFRPQQLDMQGLMGQSGFNAGQDALMQMLRATPQSNLNRSLNATIAGQGNPFDTSAMFEALGAVDTRNTNQQVAGLRAGASGLGQRFGSGMLGAETALRQGISTDINARNAGIQQGSYESAQARMLQAAQQLAARDQFQAGLADNIRQGGLDMSALFMQNNNANNAAGAQAVQMGQQDQNFQAQLLQMLLGAQQNRQAFNLSTLGLGAGMQPSFPGYGFGSAASDFGQMMMFYQMMNQPMTGGRNTATDWR